MNVLLHSSHSSSSSPPSGDALRYNGSSRGINFVSYMALTDIQAVCSETNNTVYFELGLASGRTINNNYIKSNGVGMEFELIWTKHRKPSSLKAQLTCTAKPFIPWHCRIPKSDEYHEFL
ncbi:hypothetical protein POM88_002806 [Heracleum sosnowskyi]|uniref:Uncharacterized protein n=1 Tax=Heracleum sosnowskyi TaxID=360622 RepID=A0AAD8NCC1_9APIA|nr:hypothetical protein POM88_002806 [Heracleum sosnowskyi]